MTFKGNYKFWQKYDRLFKEDPVEANMFLLFAEITEERGYVKLPAKDPAPEIDRLMTARFNDQTAYQRSRYCEK